MDKTYLNLLEFNKLLALISEHANSEATKRLIQDIAPLSEIKEIETRQGQINEIMRMSHEGRRLRISHFQDISALISKVRPEGAVLEAFELAGFIPVLEISADISEQVREREELSFLRDLCSGLTGFPEILRILKRSVDSEGNILDSASALLADLREQIRRLETRIRKRLEEMVRDEKIAIFLQDDFITKRSGRWVIPVRMDSKGQVAGVVHDLSKSGETAFIEPLAIINLANELENLIAEEKAEEIRILKLLSGRIRESADAIDREYLTVVYVDLLNAISGFAISMDMEIPRINDTGTINLIEARHPLLQRALSRSGEQVIPLDVSLGKDTTVMVITGSNAGGKTIAIKTIGLLLLMALSGMPVPADSSSTLPMKQGLLVDIGDEQSIESSLSTFSAHISNISRILKGANKAALVLIDELGTGTDPDEGAALACAVLKELRQSSALVFATTHLADIKGFVHRTEGMMNASMEFDQRTLTPLYRLRIGEPGQSHALETARRYGLPESIIDSAKAMLGGIKVEFDNLIADLNRKRTEYEKALQEIERQKKETEEINRLAADKMARAEERQKEHLAKAYQEASDIIADTRRQIYRLLEEARKKDKAAAREAMQKTEALQKQLSGKLREYDIDDTESPSPDEISEGDTVFVKSLGYDARVVKVLEGHNRIRVQAGAMEIELPIQDIRRKKGKALEKGSRLRTEGSDEMPVSRINLVGLRVEEALSRLEPFLNHASLAGLSEVTIIHGFGTGILAKAVREHLEGHPLIKKFRSGDKSEGGGGVTVANMI
ncbi:MAG: endonuclease MutS2 [Nitrospirae bacterium]|nr:endonuclease MutS2 [Nitrospirota bacterium]